MIPVVNLANIWVLISLVLYTAMFVYAIYRIKSKDVLSFAILFYLVSIAMYSNILVPIPGIIAERFLLIPSLGFCIAIVYLLFRIFKVDLKSAASFNSSMAKVSLVIVIILIPYSIKTYSRNIDWRTKFMLYSADLPHLENSVKAHDFYAELLMSQVNQELQKPVDVTKFLRPTIDEALGHWKKAVEILPSHYSSWTNLGIVYTRIYKEHDKAILCFEEALKFKPDFGQALFGLGQAHEASGNVERAMEYYTECIRYYQDNINARSRLANLNFANGNFQKALELNEEIIQIDPKESLPYVNFGNYYMIMGDTLKGVSFFEQAVNKGAPSQVSIFLMRYYDSMGDQQKSDYYMSIIKQQNPGTMPRKQ
jgi:tetratricopeptide (TPR) repeat protein